MHLSWLKDKPIIGLAPMAGWTDSPFRQICKEQGADLVFSEMIPAVGIIHKKKLEVRGEKFPPQPKADEPLAQKADQPMAEARGLDSLLFQESEYPDRQIGDEAIQISAEGASRSGTNYPECKLVGSLYFTEAERPFVMQIFGKDPDQMAEACRILNEGIIHKKKLEVRGEKLEVSSGLITSEFMQRPDEININFGCPAKSAVKSGHGVALMDNPDLAEEIVRRCVEKSPLPVSIKMRTGWTDPSEAVPFAQRMVAAGAAAIYIHGRTFKQKYSGVADWQKIDEVARSVEIPVVGNGDIDSPEVRSEKFPPLADQPLAEEVSSGLLAGVLIGRAARGNPWIFNRNSSNMTNWSDWANWTDRHQIILKHARLMFKNKGEHGIIEFRKHLLAYFHGFPGAAKLRSKLVLVKSLSDIKEALGEVRSELKLNST